jgi:hypothetical protein
VTGMTALLYLMVTGWVNWKTSLTPLSGKS